ncbi:MAG: hypothetical protein J5929_05965, partial [Eubacterium sp.]|nr:hypothetical protein [Eubacterium sp.]
RRGTGLGGAQYCKEVKCIVKSAHLIAEHSAIFGGFPHLISECKFTLSIITIKVDYGCLEIYNYQ